MLDITIKREFGIIVLAAGKGTRMESDLVKVLHEVAGRPMIHYVIKTASELSPTKTVVVVGHQGERVQDYLKDRPAISFIDQKEMLGTGHAVKSCQDEFKDFSGPILVLYGDIPGIRVETLRRLRMLHDSHDNAVTLLTAELEDPTGYGRVMVSVDGTVSRIVEEKDATNEEREVTEINTGIGIYEPHFLFESVNRLKPTNQQKEYYLTDVVSDARAHGRSVGRMQIKDPLETLGINDRNALAEVTRFFEDDKAARLLESGVTLEDPGTTSVHPDAEIGRDSIVEGRVLIRGMTRIGRHARIGGGSEIHGSTIKDRCRVGRNALIQNASIQEETQIGSNTTVGLRNED